VGCASILKVFMEVQKKSSLGDQKSTRKVHGAGGDGKIILHFFEQVKINVSRI
jgi:hypothetical protein